MYNVWFLIVLILALVVLFIIIRRFPALAILDADNIPEEKEEKIKEKISRERIKRKFSFLNKYLSPGLVFLNKIFNSFWLKLRNLKKIKEEKREENNLSKINLEERVELLFSQANNFIKNENWNEAEKKLVDIISINDKNFLAFLKLGHVYQFQEKWQEAKQTLLYALKLSETLKDSVDNNNVANLNYSLALINKELNDIEASFNNISRLLDLDPNNPRYLDLMLDLCIIKENKVLAYEFLNKIKKVNPDNNNIPEWEEKINSL